MNLGKVGGTGMLRHVVVLLVALGLLTAWPQEASADQEDRPVPNYDGREEPAPTAGEVLIWVPRVVFYPVYLATEYLVRKPLGALLTWLERENVLDRVFSAFTFGTQGRVGLTPTFLVDFGFRPSVGLYLWATNFLGGSDSFSLHVATGGARWWRLSVRETFFFGGQERGPDDPDQPVVPLSGTPLSVDDPKRELSFHFLLDYRPDYLFFGLGPDVGSLPTRFEQRILGGSIAYTENFGHFSHLRLRAHTSRNDLDDGDAGRDDGEVLISNAFDVDDPDVVPGFDGYVLGLLGLELDLDSRRPRPNPGSGVRFEATADLGTDFADTDVLFLRYGGEINVFIDLSGRQQVLGLRQWVGLIEELGDAPTPFPEQYVVGGSADNLRGLLEGRYRGISGTVTTLSYTYPIWVFLDGYVFADIGNAWGENLAGFDVEKMAMSFGIGMRSSGRDDVFNLLLGFGTTPLDSPTFGVESIRLLFGTTSGF